MGVPPRQDWEGGTAGEQEPGGREVAEQAEAGDWGSPRPRATKGTKSGSFPISLSLSALSWVMASPSLQLLRFNLSRPRRLGGTALYFPCPPPHHHPLPGVHRPPCPARKDSLPLRLSAQPRAPTPTLLCTAPDPARKLQSGNLVALWLCSEGMTSPSASPKWPGVCRGLRGMGTGQEGLSGR